MRYSVKTISAKQAHDIRHPVLRKGKPREACMFAEDNMGTTLHIGLFANEQHIGTVTLIENLRPGFHETIQYQLRGMAVLEDFRSKGLGKLMVDEGERMLKERGAQRIWLNARIKALNFYRRLGYEICSKEFEVPIFGPHFQMTKLLQ